MDNSCESCDSVNTRAFLIVTLGKIIPPVGNLVLGTPTGSRGHYSTLFGLPAEGSLGLSMGSLLKVLDQQLGIYGLSRVGLRT